MIERWLPVSGFETRYEISNFGRVRSVERIVRQRYPSGVMSNRRVRSKILALNTWGAQYPGITLRYEDGSGVRAMVHRLVAEAFIPNPDGCEVVNHLDCDPFNCREDNLEWCNTSRNVSHSYETGRRKVGHEHHFAILPRDEAGRVVSIRNAKKSQKITNVGPEEAKEVA